MNIKKIFILLLSLTAFTCGPRTRHHGTGAESAEEAVHTLIQAFREQNYTAARQVTGWDTSFDCGGILLLCLDPSNNRELSQFRVDHQERSSEVPQISDAKLFKEWVKQRQAAPLAHQTLAALSHWENGQFIRISEWEWHYSPRPEIEDLAQPLHIRKIGQTWFVWNLSCAQLPGLIRGHKGTR